MPLKRIHFRVFFPVSVKCPLMHPFLCMAKSWESSLTPSPSTSPFLPNLTCQVNPSHSSLPTIADLPNSPSLLLPPPSSTAPSLPAFTPVRLLPSPGTPPCTTAHNGRLSFEQTNLITVPLIKILSWLSVHLWIKSKLLMVHKPHWDLVPKYHSSLFS